MSNENPRFFIAYTQADKEVYKKFRKLFEEHIPTYWSVWTGSEIFIGSNWTSQINNQLNTNDYLIVLLSMNFSSSTFINTEISNLFNNNRIIPVLLKSYQYTSDSFYTDKQVFLFTRKNKNSLSFEEYIDLSNRTNEIDGKYSSSFMLDLIAFIKDANADLLIAEENHNKTGILHLNNCELSEWPNEIFDMSWIKILNLGNYYNDFDQVNNNFIHSGDKSSKSKNQNSISQIDPRIKNLDNLTHLSLERNNISQIKNLENNINLKLLELGGNKINKITGLEKLTQLESLYLYTNEIESIGGLETLQNLKFLYSAGNKIKNLEGLKNLKNLQEVYLFNNSISKMAKLVGLPKLMKLNLNSNLIEEIESQNLPNLNWLSLDRNKLEKIKGLENLHALQYLHLENNQILKIEGLNTLTKLILLHLENNQITNIEGLSTLENLQELDLQRNYIERVENLGNLFSLTKLNLSENKIQSSNGILGLNKLNNLKEVNFKLNPFIHDPWLNQEILESIGNDKEKFFAYLMDQNQKRLIEDYIPPLKIILLGNSEDGKTSLALKLINGWDTENREDSTHGLKIRKWKIDDSKTALIYDFGGQDYYHASYNMFFTWNTGYILVWDAARQANQMISAKRDSSILTSDNQYRIYPVGFWLGNIEYWKRKKLLPSIPNKGTSEITTQIKLISVQNTFSSEPAKIISSTYHIDSQLTVYLGSQATSGIQKTRRQLLKEALIDTFSDLFNSPFPLTNDDISIISEIIDSKSYQVLTLSAFNIKFPNASQYLLDLMHSRGIVLHYKDVDSLKDFVWLSPDATSTQIFNLLNIEALKNKGRIPIKEFKCEDKLKALMIHSEILFEHSIENGVTEYIIPSYLPFSPNDDALLTLATTDIKSGFSIRFKDYMPHGIMARLICRFGKSAGSNCFFRDLLIFSVYLLDSDLSIKVWIKVDFGNLRLDVKSNVDDKSKEKLHEYLFHVILRAYWNLPHKEFDTFATSTSPETNLEGSKSDSPKELVNKEPPFSNLVNFPFYLSLDGEYFLFYSDDLKPESQTVPTHVRLFTWGDQLNNKEEFRSAFNAFTKNKKPIPKKLFISYSSKDSAFMKRFTTHLESLKREGLISYWVDRMVETGTSWDDKIRQEIEGSDIIIYLLSPDFLATSYIMDVELPKGIQLVEKNPQEKKLEFIQLMPCGWKRIPSLSKNQQLLDNEAVGKDRVIINSHDNDIMWMKVIENLAIRIESMQKNKI